VKTRTYLTRLFSLYDLVLFDSDDGGGSGAPAAGAAAGDQGTAGGSGAGQVGAGTGADGSDAGASDPEVKMSQKDFEALIDKRIGQARKGWEKEINDAASLADESEQQRLAREAEEARTAGQQAIAQANTRLVQASATLLTGELGVKNERVGAVLRLTDLQEVEVKDGVVDEKAVKAAIESVLKEYPEFKSAGTLTPGAAGGAPDNGGAPPSGKPTTLEQAVAARLAG
jgi:hypothetical protein